MSNGLAGEESTAAWVCRPKVAVGNAYEEVRVVDAATGGEKGLKIDRYDLIPPEFEEALAVHYGQGAKKYADRNWEKGYDWNLSYRSVRSHLNAWLRGEDNDPETGTNHLICSIWHLIALYIFQIRALGKDTIRRKRPIFLGAPAIGSGGLGNFDPRLTSGPTTLGTL